MVAPSGDARRVNTHLLNAMRNELLRVVVPELSTDQAKASAHWLSAAIDYLLLGEQDLLPARALRAGLVDRLPSDAPNLGYLPEVGDGEGYLPRIASAVRQWGQNTPTSVIRDIANATAVAIHAENDFLQRQRSVSLEALQTVDIAVTAAILDKYFDSSELAGHRTCSIVQLTGGFSKDTFLVETTTADAKRRDLVIRRDLPFGPVEGSATDERPLLDRLNALGIPVPNTVIGERDPKWLGWPFLITERLPGAAADGVFAADKEAGADGARQLARILGRLHRIEPQAIGLAVADNDPRSQVAAYVSYWRHRWELYRCVESDLMEAALVWLEAHMPVNVERAVIIHGDYRPGNALWHESRISGMVDWEFIHAGDAAEDVEYAKLFIAPFLDADDFIAEYLAAGGVAYDPANADFYEVFRAVRNVICIETSWHGFLHGKYPALKPAFCGYHLRRLVLGFLADALQRVTRKKSRFFDGKHARLETKQIAEDFETGFPAITHPSNGGR